MHPRPNAISLGQPLTSEDPRSPAISKSICAGPKIRASTSDDDFRSLSRRRRRQSKMAIVTTTRAASAYESHDVALVLSRSRASSCSSAPMRWCCTASAVSSRSALLMRPRSPCTARVSDLMCLRSHLSSRQTTLSTLPSRRSIRFRSRASTDVATIVICVSQLASESPKVQGDQGRRPPVILL